MRMVHRNQLLKQAPEASPLALSSPADSPLTFAISAGCTLDDDVQVDHELLSMYMRTAEWSAMWVATWIGSRCVEEARLKISLL